jgi:hypothetical protein
MATSFEESRAHEDRFMIPTEVLDEAQKALHATQWLKLPSWIDFRVRHEGAEYLFKRQPQNVTPSALADRVRHLPLSQNERQNEFLFLATIDHAGRSYAIFRLAERKDDGVDLSGV